MVEHCRKHSNVAQHSNVTSMWRRSANHCSDSDGVCGVVAVAIATPLSLETGPADAWVCCFFSWTGISDNKGSNRNEGILDGDDDDACTVATR